MAMKHDALGAWRGLDEGQQVAIIKKLYLAGGGKNGDVQVFERILRGELGIELRDLAVKLVDQHGRFIPPTGFKSSVVDANRQFHVAASVTFHCNSVVAAPQSQLPNFKFGTGNDLEQAIVKLRPQIESNPQVSNLLRGAGLPLQLPQMVIGDLGTVLEQDLIPGVEQAYLKAFPERKFYNYRKGELAGQVGTVPESGQDRLTRMLAQGPVNGLYFSNPFQGFGIEACREMMQHLPEGFILCGVVETAIALMAHTSILARDNYTPVLDCAANTWRSSSFSLIFNARVSYLLFDRRILHASDSCSGGVLFVGQ